MNFDFYLAVAKFSDIKKADADFGQNDLTVELGIRDISKNISVRGKQIYANDIYFLAADVWLALDLVKLKIAWLDDDEK